MPLELGANGCQQIRSLGMAGKPASSCQGSASVRPGGLGLAARGGWAAESDDDGSQLTPDPLGPPRPCVRRARRRVGVEESPVEEVGGGTSHEQPGSPTAETPAAVVRARGLARSSRALPTQRRPVPVDHVEQARLGCAAPHDHRAEVRARTQRHHRLPRRRPQSRRAGDERLGRGPSLVVAQPPGAPGRRRSIGAPAPTPGAGAPFRGGGA